MKKITNTQNGKKPDAIISDTHMPKHGSFEDWSHYFIDLATEWPAAPAAVISFIAADETQKEPSFAPLEEDDVKYFAELAKLVVNDATVRDAACSMGIFAGGVNDFLEIATSGYEYWMSMRNEVNIIHLNQLVGPFVDFRKRMLIYMLNNLSEDGLSEEKWQQFFANMQ